MDIDQNSDIDPQKESSNPAELKQIIRNMRIKKQNATGDRNTNIMRAGKLLNDGAI
jgi:hypothetical protein